MLRETPNTESVIVEYGFLDSSGDDVAQLKNNWKNYAEAVVKALANYVGVPYTNEEDGDYYIVKSGDTLWSIARKYNTTIDKIKELNNLKSNSLSIGQKLLVRENIPTTENGEYYIVKAGDTLYGIARKYNMTVDEIKRLNNLSSDSLSIGQRLMLKKEETPIVSNYDTYTVQKGDSLWSIANKYNTNVKNLMDINNLSSNLLSVGQKLLIPKLGASTTTYVVKAGDNLYSIARRYGTTVNEIMNANGLKSTNLSIGQVLNIP